MFRVKSRSSAGPGKRVFALGGKVSHLAQGFVHADDIAFLDVDVLGFGAQGIDLAFDLAGGAEARDDNAARVADVSVAARLGESNLFLARNDERAKVAHLASHGETPGRVGLDSDVDLWIDELFFG